MQIAKIENNAVVQVADYRVMFPQTSFPDSGPSGEFMQANSCLHVTMFKPYDRATEKLVTVAPYIDGDRVFTVAIEPLTQAEIEANATAAAQAIINQITIATQSRLDTFARTRNYDGILSACTYATSTITKFQVEGQYCVNMRDATWMVLYSIMDAVEAGTRPMPSGYADIESDLPVLEWPA
jgi:hypothetical protein